MRRVAKSKFALRARWNTPCLLPHPMATLEKPLTASHRASLPICVLDDERELVEQTTQRLEKAGFPAVGCIDPAQALDIVHRGDAGWFSRTCICPESTA